MKTEKKNKDIHDSTELESTSLVAICVDLLDLISLKEISEGIYKQSK